MNKQRYLRQQAINKITSTLKQIHTSGKEPDMEQLIMAVMIDGVSRRTAREYIKVAEFMVMAKEE